MVIDFLLVAALIVGALVTVMTARLIRAAVGLAVTSALLTVVMFRLDSPLAAVFELSVCAGLIPAIFISAIGLTRRLDPEGLQARKKDRLRRYWLLPIIVVAAAAVLSLTRFHTEAIVPTTVSWPDARTVLWNMRHLDLIGQIALLLGAAFAVVALIKETRHE